MFQQRLTQESKQDQISDEFKQLIKNLTQEFHGDETKALIDPLVSSLSNEEIKRVVQFFHELLEILSSEIEFLDLYTTDFSNFEELGWEIHKGSQFASWTREEDKVLENAKEGMFTKLCQFW